MPRSPLAWTLHSPKRLIGTLAAVVVLVAAGSTWSAGRSNDPGSQEPVADAETGVSRELPAPPPSATRSESTEPTPSPSAAASAGETPSRDHSQAKGVARAFLTDWLATPAPRQQRAGWLDRVRGHVTPQLYTGLRHTDPANLPRGRVENVAVTAAGAYTTRLTVRLSSGTRLQLQLLDQGGHWAVANIDEAPGR